LFGSMTLSIKFKYCIYNQYFSMKLQCSLRSFLTFEITPSDHLSPKATGDRIRARLGLITKDSDTFVT
jgi:hypothetical protein